MSAESGIPTFRGPGGLWRHYRAEELATAQAFANRPNLVWEWYGWRRELMAKAQPHAGHAALAALEARIPDFTLITQNVDGLDERAGIRNVIRLHGDIWRTVCTRCGDQRENREVPLATMPPHCFCAPDALLRPAVVWFGETLPSEAWLAAEDAMARAELLLVIGTSAVVYPASSLVPLAIRSGAQTVEINPQPTALSDEVDIRLAGSASELLPRIVGGLQAEI
jgi:NAD-dependent deacetylase